jgi:hypothetical protein
MGPLSITLPAAHERELNEQGSALLRLSPLDKKLEGHGIQASASALGDSVL